jgi:phosphatidylcholine synthase
MATLAVIGGRYEETFLWLFVALVIDAVDGTLARAVGVAVWLPRFSGERLDLVIDYLTYVFVPVLALLHAGFLTGGLGIWLAAAVLLSSLYHFADLESKTDDNCFVGFPAVWNLIAFCLFAWNLKGTRAALLIAVLVVLTFVPMRWLHPLRVRRHFALNVAVMLAGLTAAGCVLLQGFPAGPFTGGLLAVSALYFAIRAALAPWAGIGGGEPGRT